MISHYYHHLFWREFEFLGFSEVHSMDEYQAQSAPTHMKQPGSKFAVLKF